MLKEYRVTFKDSFNYFYTERKKADHHDINMMWHSTYRAIIKEYNGLYYGYWLLNKLKRPFCKFVVYKSSYDSV